MALSSFLLIEDGLAKKRTYVDKSSHYYLYRRGWILYLEEEQVSEWFVSNRNHRLQIRRLHKLLKVLFVLDDLLDWQAQIEYSSERFCEEYSCPL